MHLIAVNDKVRDGNLSVGTVHCNAKCVAAASRTIAALKSLLNVMDVVLQKFDVGTTPHHVYTQRRELMVGSVEITNFDTLYSHVTLIMDGKYALSSSGGEVLSL